MCPYIGDCTISWQYKGTVLCREKERYPNCTGYVYIKSNGTTENMPKNAIDWSFSERKTAAAIRGS